MTDQLTCHKVRYKPGGGWKTVCYVIEDGDHTFVVKPIGNGVAMIEEHSRRQGYERAIDIIETDRRIISTKQQHTRTSRHKERDRTKKGVERSRS